MKRFLLLFVLLLGLASCAQTEEPPRVQPDPPQEEVVKPEPTPPVIEADELKPTTAVVAAFTNQEDALSRLHPDAARYESLADVFSPDYQTIVVYNDGQESIWGSSGPFESQLLSVNVGIGEATRVYIVNVSDPDLIPVVLRSLEPSDFTREDDFQITLNRRNILFVVEDLTGDVADELRSYIERVSLEDVIVDQWDLAQAYLFERVLVIQQQQPWDEIPGTPNNFELVSGELAYGLLTYKYRIDELLPGWQSSVLTVIDKIYFMLPGETDTFIPMAR